MTAWDDTIQLSYQQGTLLSGTYHSSARETGLKVTSTSCTLKSCKIVKGGNDYTGDKAKLTADYKLRFNTDIKAGYTETIQVSCTNANSVVPASVQTKTTPVITFK